MAQLTADFAVLVAVRRRQRDRAPQPGAAVPGGVSLSPPKDDQEGERDEVKVVDEVVQKVLHLNVPFISGG